MRKPSEPDPIATFSNPTENWDKWREGIIGFGERSSRKTYYAELQKQLEELERFKSLLDQSHDAIFVMEAATCQFRDVNETACRLLRYGKPEMLCMSLDEILDAQIAQQLRTAFVTGATSPDAQQTITTMLHTRDHHEIPVEMSIRFVEFANIAYTVAVARDITERMRVQQERDRILSERNLILENVAVGIIFLKDREFIWINEGMQDLFGYAYQELQGRTTEILYLDHESYVRVGRDAYRMLAEGGRYDEEIVMKRKDGTVFWCHLLGQAADPKNLTQGSIWILEDVTERKQIEEARQKLNEELELRVQERTAELAQANAAIRALNEQLKDENIQMRTEMDLARRIQTSLLPQLNREIHPDFEIAAIMVPAEEVGGDYYDITFDQQGNLWFGIGDVSGHGVTPGLIMMMAQTAHTTVASSFDASPSEVLTILNRVLYHNVHNRLGADHFMTFTALKYLGQGRFEHAGMHLDMIVYRQATQTCETIETQGMWLNLLADITFATTTSAFTLAIGDVLVLYTDGLTEAQNRQQELLDLPRLIETVARHAGEETCVLRDSILHEVTAWCENQRNDDMSLVVARRIK